MSQARFVEILRAGAGGLCVAVVVACGSGTKHADSPGTCPEGTILRGDDCVPSDSPGEPSGGPAKSANRDGDDLGAGAKAPTKVAAEPAEATGAGGKPVYDKEAVEEQLKRAARQVKANCGSASDEEGAKVGPWGRTKASVTLGRNGHVKQVSVPAPFEGKPVGGCAVHAFEKLVFPPYAGSSDVTVDWDIDIVEPKQK